MTRFRLFGRSPGQARPDPDAHADPGARYPEAPPPGPRWAGTGRPTGWAAPHGTEPPTDPRGFPSVPPPRPAWQPVPTPDAAEAAALAGAFAVDYLSWDEEEPARRGRVLRDYLAVPGGDPARIGWNGEGRQRADFALPGRVRPDGDGRVLVDVRVRVTPYRAVGEHDGRASGGDAQHGQVGVPAVAPAPTGRGWRSQASRWVRLSVPVVWENGRLAVDAWEETLGADEPPPPAPAVGWGGEHALAEDDPLAELSGGAR